MNPIVCGRFFSIQNENSHIRLLHQNFHRFGLKYRLRSLKSCEETLTTLDYPSSQAKSMNLDTRPVRHKDVKYWNVTLLNFVFWFLSFYYRHYVWLHVKRNTFFRKQSLINCTINYSTISTLEYLQLTFYLYPPNLHAVTMYMRIGYPCLASFKSWYDIQVYLNCILYSIHLIHFSFIILFIQSGSLGLIVNLKLCVKLKHK